MRRLRKGARVRHGRTSRSLRWAERLSGRVGSGLIAAAVVGFVALAALKILVTWLEPRLAFFPVAGGEVTPLDVGIPYRDLTIRTTDGEKLEAWLLPHPNPRAEVLYFHGNGGNLSGWTAVLAGIHRRGFTVLAVDYRGYGRSTGRPSERGLYRDAEALVATFRNGLHQTGVPIVYWGRSLGCAVAAHASRVAEPDGLILEAGFPDARAVLRGSPVLAFLALFSSYRFATTDLLRAGSRPVLVIHGEADLTIPPELGRRLYEAIDGPRSFHGVPGGHHNDVEPAAAEGYWRAVLQFVESLMSPCRSGGCR